MNIADSVVSQYSHITTHLMTSLHVKTTYTRVDVAQNCRDNFLVTEKQTKLSCNAPIAFNTIGAGILILELWVVDVPLTNLKFRFQGAFLMT